MVRIPDKFASFTNYQTLQAHLYMFEYFNRLIGKGRNLFGNLFRAVDDDEQEVDNDKPEYQINV